MNQPIDISTPEKLEMEVIKWVHHNFPAGVPPNDNGRRILQCTLGVAEEAGELCHAILKADQRIRGTREEHDAAAKDAIGDIVFFLMNLCYRKGWSFWRIVRDVARVVLARDWVKFPKNGVSE